MLKEVNRPVFYSVEARFRIALFLILVTACACAENHARGNISKSKPETIRISISKEDSLHKIKSSYQGRVLKKRRSHAK